MGRDALPCIVCGTALENVMPETSENQPYEGCAFSSHGHYGCTVFDPMDGSYLEINVCDECLVDAGRKGKVLTGRDRRPVMIDGSIRGWERVDRPLITWTKELAGWDEADAVNFDSEEQAVAFADDRRIKWMVPPREGGR